MTRWKGPQGRLWNILFGVLSVLFVLPIAYHPFSPYSTIRSLLVMILLLATFVVIYAFGRYQMSDFWDMVFRETPLTVGDAGAAIMEVLEGVGVPFEEPITRPQANGLRAWYEWELHVPDERMRVGVLTGGFQGRFVAVGPATMFNGNEIEWMKGFVDEALG